MRDRDDTKERLIEEVAMLRMRIAELEAAESKRKQAEDALRESEEKYRSLFEHSQDAILLTVPDGSILDANRAACEMFGRSPEDIKSFGRSGLVDMADQRLHTALSERASRDLHMPKSRCFVPTVTNFLQKSRRRFSSMPAAGGKPA